MVHYRAIQIDGYKTLKEGQRVKFLQTKSEKGLQAAEVEVLELCLHKIHLFNS